MTLEWTPQRLVELRQSLTKRLSDDDLRTICFDLSKLDSGLNKLDYESLPGVGKAAKIRELLDYCDRQDHIPQLYKMACDLCPAIRKDLEMPRTLLRSGLVPAAKGCYFQYGKLIFGILLTLAVISIAPFVIVNAYATSMAAARANATSTAGASMASTAIAKVYATSTAVVRANATSTAEAYATQMAMVTRRYTPTLLATPTPTFTPTPTPTPAVVLSATVTLQTWSGMYVTVTDITTTGKLKAQDAPIGDRQKFTLLCLANGKTALQIFDRFVSALNDEPGRDWELRAGATERLAWEEFTLVNPDTQASLPCVQVLKQLQQSEVRLAFRTFHNSFVTAMGQDADWVLRAKTTVLDKYEKFTAINLASTPTPTPTSTPCAGCSACPTQRDYHCLQKGAMVTVTPGRSDEYCTETVTLPQPTLAYTVYISMTKRALEDYGYSLYEVEAYGSGNLIQNLLLNGKVISSSQDNGWDPSYVTDGKMLYSRWDSTHCCTTPPCPRDNNGTIRCNNAAGQDPQWLKIILPRPATVDRIVLKWERAYAVEYCVIINP